MGVKSPADLALGAQEETKISQKNLLKFLRRSPIEPVFPGYFSYLVLLICTKSNLFIDVNWFCRRLYEIYCHNRSNYNLLSVREDLFLRDPSSIRTSTFGGFYFPGFLVQRLIPYLFVLNKTFRVRYSRFEYLYPPFLLLFHNRHSTYEFFLISVFHSIRNEYVIFLPDKYE